MSWSNIRGHDAQVRAFEHVYRRGRLAHAYLFAGPPGIGKRTFAVELGKALLCEAPGRARFEACGQCPACLLVAAGTHPDLFVTGRPEDSLEVPIEAIRELCHAFSLKPARGRHKVAILDDADDLNPEAANCFLKTLEEPPPGAMLVLVGTSAERQLPTIVSRCQVVRFSPLPDAVVEELLRREELEDPQLVPLLTKLGQGSPGQARALADPGLWAFRKNFLRGLVQGDTDTVALAKEWTEFTEEAGKESAAQRRRAGQVLRMLIEFLRDALRVASGGTPRQSHPEDPPLFDVLNQKVGAEAMLQLIDRCLEAQAQLEGWVQLALVLESVLDALDQIKSARPQAAR